MRKMCRNREEIETETDPWIITVGSTGTGKESLRRLLTQQYVAVSDGLRSQSAKYALFINKRDPCLPPWLDIVGCDDSGGKDDQLSLQDFLHFLNKRNITKIKAIIWTVPPHGKKDAGLQSQADFIDQIYPGKIWNNVVIFADGGTNSNQDCQRALEAARDKCKHTEIRTLSCKCFQDLAHEKKLKDLLNNDPKMREYMKVVTDEEAYNLLKRKLDSITNPVKVLFKNKKCVDCGVVGDERLLPKYCHSRKFMEHEGELERYHPGKREKYHLLNLYAFHPGRIEIIGGPDKDWVLADNIIGLIPFVSVLWRKLTEAKKAGIYTDIGFRYTCCKRQAGDRGCETIWKCCETEKSNPGCGERYDCCFSERTAKGCELRYNCCMKTQKADGCVAKCKNCDALWGTTSRGCVIKSHNLVKL